MPLYSFSNPANPNQVVDIVMSMNDVHEYVVDGVKWDRVWTKPQASFDTKIDPFNQNQFIEKTGKRDGQKVGDIWERSAEMSDLRAKQAGGVDPVKEKYYKNYSKARKGKPHAKQIRERAKKMEITI